MRVNNPVWVEIANKCKKKMYVLVAGTNTNKCFTSWKIILNVLSQNSSFLTQ